MSIRIIYQYIQRFLNVYFVTIPGRYQQRKKFLMQKYFVKMNEMMLSLGKEYWIDFGTLLGHHRENGIISHDIDIDFGMHEKDYKYVVNRLHEKCPHGITFYDTSANHRGPKLYFSYKGIFADIYFYEDCGQTIRSYENSKYLNETSKISKSLVYPIQKAKFLNQKTFIPSKTKEYLEHIYGYIGRDAIRDKKTGYFKKHN